jgi:hypothetical protein
MIGSTQQTGETAVGGGGAAVPTYTAQVIEKIPMIQRNSANRVQPGPRCAFFGMNAGIAARSGGQPY